MPSHSICSLSSSGSIFSKLNKSDSGRLLYCYNNTCLHHLCPVHEVLTGICNPLISAQIIVNSFGQGKCTFGCPSGNLKKKTMPLATMSQQAHAC